MIFETHEEINIQTHCHMPNCVTELKAKIQEV